MVPLAHRISSSIAGQTELFLLSNSHSKAIPRIHATMSAMDLDAPVSIAPRFNAEQTSATILCCNCGAAIDGTTSAGALCYDCVKLTIDVSQGIQREATLHFCRDCDRWLLPPSTWIVAALESRELLALCLKKLRGLHKVRIIDASFIWTEPHSRRVKVKLTIQDSVSEGVVLQQAFEVEYVVAYQQCPDCAKSYTANTWRACVQVRQKVPHKRTFLYLEQLILKHGAHKDTINIKEVKDGLDFYYSARNQAEKFVDFLNSVAPVRSKKSQELISMDIHTSTKSYKFSYSVELVPICKDDLVAIPIKLAKQIGNISPLGLCYRVGTSVNILDPSTLQTADVSTPIYWRAPFVSLADVQELVEFIIMDIEPLGPVKGRWALAEATVARAADLGSNDKTYYTRTHLGNVLHPGDSVMGYMLTGTNFNSPQFDALEESNTYSTQIPDVMLVKKFYARKKKAKNRSWRLKRMTREEGDVLPRKQDQEKMDRDYEMFLRDVEEDTELRQTLALYKAQQKAKEDEAMSVVETEDGDDDETPKINMEELLDEFEELQVNDQQ
ncbi:60S ribosomal export protein NMD3 [Phlyctema vagabunda]|uniref:60S ribosomal export protein NMD3 n=1 Tax=Phlyctema vagabunda TaxID=108571 RepID=A0ABR4PVN5_9HELO